MVSITKMLALKLPKKLNIDLGEKTWDFFTLTKTGNSLKKKNTERQKVTILVPKVVWMTEYNQSTHAFAKAYL